MIDKAEIGFNEWAILLSHYGEIFALLGSTIILSIMMVRHAPKQSKIKWLSVPLILFLFYGIITKANDILGYAYPKIPEGQTVILNHVKSGEFIEIWLHHVGERETRLYKIPYSEQLYKKMKEEELGAKIKGVPYVVEWKPKEMQRNYEEVFEQVGITKQTYQHKADNN